MASEYLQRTPTSTGNRRVWTWSTWVKRNSLTSTNQNLLCSTEPGLISKLFFNTNDKLDYQNNSPSFELITSQTFRDVGNWFHILFVAETTASISSERIRIYVNGARITKFDTETYPSINSTLIFNYPIAHFISKESSATNWFIGEFADVFFIDGQALTPDVFGFYKQGKGYISVGSTQSTDFRPGQWVPKTPRVIKTEINRRGGFGVNGFYLPMNDSKNFGADFHCDPNSIITLNEKLPQPRVGVATTASVGLGYTDALRADPYAANLVLALPFVSGGLNSGFGDYAPSIKGSGSAKTITTTSVSIANTASYYGSAMYAVGPNNYATASSSSDFNFGTGDFTVECWVYLLSQGNSGYNHYLSINDQNTFAFKSWSSYYYLYANSGTAVQTSNAPRLNQWTHLALVRKGTQLTIFENGVAAGITTNYTSSLGATAAAQIGNASNTSSEGLNGYIQDLRVYKGVAKYTGGFDVPRPYTPVGIATWRAVPDTTANNFATLNPLYPVISGSNSTYTNGNLTVSDATSNGSQVSATIGVSTGKWYYEALAGNVSGGSHLIGIRPAEWFTFNPQNRTSYRSDGSVYNDAGGTAQSGTSYSSSDIIGVAIDMNTRKLWFSKNGSFVYSGNPSAGTNEAVSFASTYTHYAPAAMFDNVAGTQTWDTNFGQNPTFSGNTTAGTFTDSNGKGLFKYQPPSGFLALCEDNLPTPAISDPGKYFKTVLYTGDGNSGRSIVGVGFTPDLVWVKNRTGTQWHILTNSVVGPAPHLFTNATNAEVAADTAGYLNSFSYDGFSVQTGSADITNLNASSNNYVAWCWRAGAGTTSTNTNGSITSVVSVNQDAGFSIVSYTGNGVDGATIGHGLGKTPALIIAKGRDNAVNWPVYHKSTTVSNFLYLNSTSAALASSAMWNSNPSSSVFYVGNQAQNNTNALRYIAYCWAEIEGFSKFGSYVGNGNADGPFVYCGFKPAFVMVKRTDGGVENWIIFDNVRKSYNDGDQRALFPNLADAEGTGWPIDFLSNGFKNRYTGSSNTNGATYIFAAFAESPFTTANAK